MIIIHDYIDGEGGGGKGGGGGGSRAAVEAPNTLQSVTTVRILELISEGEIGGLYTGDGRSIRINNTPLQNPDLSYNFQKTVYDQRVGLPSQPYMPGFPSASAQYSVGTDVLAASPVVKSISAGTIDSVKFGIILPDGLTSQDTSNGDMNGTSIQFALDRKPTASGVWEEYALITLEGKTTTPYAAQYYMTRPSGVGLWDVRIRRITADSVISSLRNKLRFDFIVETQEVKLEYENSAYVGISIDAQSVGNAIPTRSYLVKGIKCKIPSNYNPLTGVYTGEWDGSFNIATTDNPAWVLYDIIINTRYGMGRFGITEDQVDKFSFYDAGVYSDGLVDDGDGGLERRFTFNTVIGAATDALQQLQNMAGMMNANLAYVNGLISVNQDRPATAVKLITKANIIDGFFAYKSSSLPSRSTSVNVTWNDASDNTYLPRVSSIDDADGIARYGFNPTDVAAYGATTEGQALRAGKWVLYTGLNQLEIVNFKMGMSGFDLRLGDVVKIFDEDYTNQSGAGRVVSSTNLSVTLDRPVVISAGVNTIDVLSPDGTTIYTRTITTAEGTHTVLFVSEAWPLGAIPEQYADFIINSAVEARNFRILGLSQDEGTSMDIGVEAVQYDINKYTYIEDGIVIPPGLYSSLTDSTITAPQNLTLSQNATMVDGVVVRTITASWSAPETGIPVGYEIRWRKSGDNYTKITAGGTLVTFPVSTVGSYDVSVNAINFNAMVSATASQSINVNLTPGVGSVLNPVVDLMVVGGGTTFGGQDLFIQWTNPLTNNNTLSTTKDFMVEIYDGVNLLYTEYVNSNIAPGGLGQYLYTHARNTANGGPRRTITVAVYARDTNNKSSLPEIVVFTNPKPAAPTLVTTAVFRGYQAYAVRPSDIDLAGMIVWASTVDGFIPSDETKVYDGVDNSVEVLNKTENIPIYVRAAFFDLFGKTSLNISSQSTVIPAENVQDIPAVDTLPLTAPIGRVVYLTTDKKLYRFDGVVWLSSVAAADITGQLENGQIAALAASKITGQLTNAQLEEIAAAKVSGQLSNAQLAEIAATKISGQITTTQITDLSITSGKINAGAVVAGKIAAGTIVAADIAASTITGGKIAANTIAAGNIAAGTITAAEIATDAITAVKIIAGAITTAKIATGAVTALTIEANTITAAKMAVGSIATAAIAAGAVTADKITVATLSAIHANLGTVTAGTITATVSVTTAALTSGQNAISGGTFGLNSSVALMGRNATGQFDATITGKYGVIGLNSAGTGIIGAGVFAAQRSAGAVAGIAAHFTNNAYTSVSTALYQASATYAAYGPNYRNKNDVDNYTLWPNSYGLLGHLDYGSLSIMNWPSTNMNRTQARHGLVNSAGLYYNISELGASVTSLEICTLSYSAWVPVGGGSAYFSDGVGPFTGFHDGVLLEQIDIEPVFGDILVDHEVIKVESISSVKFSHKVSTVPKQKNVIGVLASICNTNDIIERHDRMSHDSVNIVTAGAYQTPSDEIPVYKDTSNCWCPESDEVVVHINSLGEGQMNVCGENGNIEAGDYITSSSVPGKGMRQDDDILHNYTVGKARESMTFSGSEIKLIACTYHCG